MIISNIWKNRIHVPNHQPVLIVDVRLFPAFSSHEKRGSSTAPIVNHHSPIWIFPEYPLVISQIAMENHHAHWENPQFLWPCSSSQNVSHYQRGAPESAPIPRDSGQRCVVVGLPFAFGQVEGLETVRRPNRQGTPPHEIPMVSYKCCLKPNIYLGKLE